MQQRQELIISFIETSEGQVTILNADTIVGIIQRGDRSENEADKKIAVMAISKLISLLLKNGKTKVYLFSQSADAGEDLDHIELNKILVSKGFTLVPESLGKSLMSKLVVTSGGAKYKNECGC